MEYTSYIFDKAEELPLDRRTVEAYMKPLGEKESSHIGPLGVIIFDGACGACSAVIGEREKFFNRYGFTVVPLQEEWVTPLTGLDKATLEEAITLYTPHQKIRRGIEVVIEVSRQVWWLTPLVILGKSTLGKRILSFAYNHIAQRRKALSAACGLQSRAIFK